jgi:hypothetical protein
MLEGVRADATAADGQHWEDAQRRRIAEGGHTPPAGLNGSVTLKRSWTARSNKAAQTGGDPGRCLRPA